MPSRWMLQPNGKLCRFSTIVDNFTHANLTAEEAFTVCFEDMGRDQAHAKVARGLARGLDDQGGWNESLRDVALTHGQEQADLVRAEILGDPEPP